MLVALILAAALLAGGASPPHRATAVAAPAAPAAVPAQTLGRSVHGRAITATAVGDPAAPRRVLVVGCIHGNERAGRAVIRRLRGMTLPAGVGLWTIDAANPDGCRANTRGNARGVDLNRNFPYRWQSLPRGTYYSGSAPLSEPESRAIRGLLQRERPAITIWYHQHARLVDSYGDARIARRYARLVGLPYKFFYAAPGSITRWQVHTYPSTTGMVVELPAGSLSPAAVRRHAAAVIALAKDAS